MTGHQRNTSLRFEPLHALGRACAQVPFPVRLVPMRTERVARISERLDIGPSSDRITRCRQVRWSLPNSRANPMGNLHGRAAIPTAIKHVPGKFARTRCVPPSNSFNLGSGRIGTAYRVSCYRVGSPSHQSLRQRDHCRAPSASRDRSMCPLRRRQSIGLCRCLPSRGRWVRAPSERLRSARRALPDGPRGVRSASRWQMAVAWHRLPDWPGTPKSRLGVSIWRSKAVSPRCGRPIRC
jgi:hypothetical protein